MNQIFRTTWEEFIEPFWRRPPERQVAALCYRGSAGDREILLVTSRGSGRWILPKGWHDDATIPPHQAAAIEAWEEAGVAKGDVDPTPLGRFDYHKLLDNGLITPLEATVFPLKVRKLADDFPERAERKRKWVKPETAMKMVTEPGLRRIIRRAESHSGK